MRHEELPRGCDDVKSRRSRELLADGATSYPFEPLLFYRLNVFPIRVPPLRERTEDIPLLIAYFVRWFSERLGKKAQEIPDEFIATLKAPFLARECS